MSKCLRDLLHRFKTGDRSAFEHIYVEYAPKVYRFACRYLSDKGIAEEIVQDAFVRLWEARSFIDPDHNFDNYLFTITRNIIFNRHRKNVNELYYRTFLLASLEHEYYFTEDEIVSYDLAEYIDRVVDRLPAQQKTVFNLSRKQMLTHKEIAAQLGISEKTVEAHIYQALKTIRKEWDRLQ